MKPIKLYHWDSILDFGKHRGESLKERFIKNPEYVNYCLQKLPWFSITDDVFYSIPTIKYLINNKSIENDNSFNKLKELHENKKSLLNDTVKISNLKKDLIKEDLTIYDDETSYYDPKLWAKEGLDDFYNSDPDWQWNID